MGIILTMNLLTINLSFELYSEILTRLLQLTGKYSWWVAREAYWSCSNFSFRAQNCGRPKTGSRSIV